MGEPEAAARARFEPLDLLRGMAVAGMLLVTSPGAWDASYAPLRHADWQGWTPADLVFPAFLFCVGMAIAIGFPRAIDDADRAAMWRKIARRSLLLILLGLLLNALPDLDLARLRIPGILQRIAICYAAVSALALLTLRRDAEGRSDIDFRVFGGTGAVLLLAYGLLLAFVPAPGVPAGQFTPEGSLPAWIDQQVFTVPHLWEWGKDAAGNVTYDPEGLLSTLGALVNVLAGALAIAALRSPRGIWIVAAAGVAAVAAGLSLDPAIPMTKRLWTDSFALFSTGASALLLVACIGWARAPAPLRALGAPLRILGANAILAFTLQQIWAAYWWQPFIPAGTTSYGIRDLIFLPLTDFTGDRQLASLITASAVVALFTLAVLPFHRKGLHLRL